MKDVQRGRARVKGGAVVAVWSIRSGHMPCCVRAVGSCGWSGDGGS